MTPVGWKPRLWNALGVTQPIRQVISAPPIAAVRTALPLDFVNCPTASAADTTGALTLWQSIVTTYDASPEAPEAELAWARALLARGERAQAAERLEHLIVTYPSSALVPIARRELERAK